MNRSPSPYGFSYSQVSNSFKPAFQYLVAGGDKDTNKHYRRRPSIDEPEEEDGRYKTPGMGKMSLPTSSDLHPGSIPLINVSRSSSPYLRTNSGLLSDEDEDDDFETVSDGRPLVASDISVGGRGWRRILTPGGLGNWLFTTCTGWQVYICFLVFWALGCGLGLLLMNRFIFLTGTYKFQYPLTATLFQLSITHLLLLASANLTRAISSSLIAAGLNAIVAPAYPAPSASSPPGYRSAKPGSLGSRFFGWLVNGSGGIAGGGLLEFDTRTALKVLPLAVVYMAKVLLSNISFAYVDLPMYLLARIGIVPLSLILGSYLLRASYSLTTLSSTLVATLNLLVATIRSGNRVIWESIVAGVFSSLFVALYPILLLRTYRSIVGSLSLDSDVLSAHSTPSNSDAPGSKEETRAGWQLLHYTSLLTIILLAPIVFLSGEVGHMARWCVFLDVPWFWFLVLCGGIGSWAVFFSTLLLVRATSPLTATFLFVPRSAFQLVILSHFKMPVYSWVGIGGCWIASLWFAVGRRREGRTLERWKMEGI